uniref:Protein kinase C n=1 Tax=Leptobrachium leishanense TaxID=445787 RepID=A0A8C5LXP0_9ANUR
MGNISSVLCCAPCRRSRRVKPSRPERRDFQHGPSQPSEHPRAADGTSAGSDGSASNIADPDTQLTFNKIRENVQREISKELKIKDGAERLRKVTKTAKHLQDVDDFLRKSTARLEELNNCLQNVNACIAEREKLQLPGMCEGLNEKNDSHPGDAAAQELNAFHVDNVVTPAEERELSELEEFNFDNVILRLVEDKPEMSDMEDVVCPVEERAESEVTDVDVLLLPVEELEMPVMEISILSAGKIRPEMDAIRVDNVSVKTRKLECIPEEFPMSFEDFHCSSVLGRGTFGKVLLAKHKVTKEIFSLKAIKKAEMLEENNVECLVQENNIVRALSRDPHPFLVNIYASFQNMHYVFFLMEYVAGGDLHTHLEKSSGVFPLTRAKFYTSCIVLGLEYLHQEKIIHRDLKLANIILDHQGFAKINDFGVSKEGIGFEDRANSFCGTLEYMAPEILLGLPYSHTVDWWSLGVLLYIMLVGEYPFPGSNDEETAENIINSSIEFPRPIRPSAADIIRNLLKKGRDRRLGSSRKGAEDVKEHLFFHKIDWDELLFRNVTPPFVPTIHGVEDTSNFEAEFTFEVPSLSPQHQRLTKTEQEAFRGFDWISEWED